MDQHRFILKVSAIYAAVAGVWVLFSDSLVLALGGSAFLGAITIVKDLTFVAVTTAVLYVLLRAVARQNLAGATARIVAYPLPVALGGVIASLLIAWLAFQQASAPILFHTLRQLQTINELQGAILQEHQAQAAANARAVGQGRAFMTLLAHWRQNNTAETREALDEALSQMAAAYGYSGIALVDVEGRRLVGTPQHYDRDRLVPFIGQVVASGEMVSLPLHRSEAAGRDLYGYLSPVAERAGTTGLRAFLLFELDARSFLYPLLAKWPIASESGESFLVLRQPDGDYLLASPLRFSKQTPLISVLPSQSLAFAAPPAEGAAPRMGIGYTGETVIGVMAPVALAGGYLVVQMDVSEALTAAYAVAVMAAILVLGGAVCVVAIASGLAQRRNMQAADALQAAESRFRATFEQAAVGIAHLSPEGNILRVNQKACEMLGYARADLLGRSYRTLCLPEDAGLDDGLMADFAAGRVEQGTSERRYVRRDGSIVWLSGTTSAVRTPAGALDYLIAVAIDISVRRAVEDQLRISEDRFHLAMMGANEGIWDVDLVQGAIYVSPSWNRMLGLDEQNVRLSTGAWRDLVLSEDQPRIQDYFAPVLRGEASQFGCDVRMKHANGSIIDTLVRGFAVADQAGMPVRLVGTQSDVTQMKQNERRLELAATVFSSAQEGLVITELDGTISTVNPAFTVMTGYGEEEVVGRGITLLRSFRHDVTVHRQIWQSLSHAGHWQGEIWIRRKNGDVYPALVRVRAVHDSTGGRVNYVSTFTDMSSLKQSESRLHHIAHHDLLTDLPNRLMLTSLLARAIVRGRDRHRVAVLFVNIDRFKTVNDSLGHAAGDEALVCAAARFRAVIGNRATLARYGGDEFVVLVEELETPADAAAVAENLMASLAAPLTLKGYSDIYLAASIGIALFPDDGVDAERLIQRADVAVARAKGSGRGTCVFYTDGMTQHANARLDMEVRLRRALTRGELSLAYQPQVDLATGGRIGAEALLRWETPSGSIPPLDFIPLAEETGLIIPIGDWVLVEVCRKIAAWKRAGLPCGRIAVNLSARQFYRADLAEHIASVIEATGADAGALEIEITESVLMEERSQAEAKLLQLRQMGVHVALDDFGTGFSSLGYIKRFPISRLKIDASFVRDVPQSLTDCQITIAIIGLAHALGLEVLAEGVEREEQVAFLRAQGCNLAQGYLFSRPLSVERFEQLLKTGPALSLPVPINS